ncbi:MAG: glycogen debranching protein GlgX [Nitrolancea sp.]
MAGTITKESSMERSFPLGAVWDGHGVSFAIYSEGATQIEVCIFDDTSAGNEQRVPLESIGRHLWVGYVELLGPGQRYGFRVHGPYDAAAGHRFNPNKLLVDPYARAVAGKVDWRAPLYGYVHGELDLSFDAQDDAWGVPKSVVIDPSFDWEGDTPLRIPLQRSIIYETHVKGFSQQNPRISPELRGTYAGLAHPDSLAYLTSLGITAVELLPVHDALDNHALVTRGLRNYWGYSTLNYFSPDARFSSRGDTGGQVTEFKEMVKALHVAGIEVILDVVYNHSCEENEFGPTLSLRGIDNRTYYRLAPGHERYYVDYTGTGNSLNVRHPQVLKLIMDSLRYWVLEMHVDGFRFDLAATLARELHDVDQLSAFFDIIHQDPVLSEVKLIAEPWDLGEGGYQVGNFPVLWSEWNGRYRDVVRRFWRGDESYVDDLAYRLTGSSDLYGGNGRGPLASINFVTAHDGFTLEDLYSYNVKHNEANGEQNTDGTDDNISWNCGVEGPTDDTAVIALREREKRNALATLLFSQGVPMICGGDEISRTQDGNNNAYNQDNEVSWYDWDLDERRSAFLEFSRRVIEIRQRHPILGRRRFFRGTESEQSGLKDITWLRSDGKEMTGDDWFTSWVRSLGILIADETGQNEHLLLLLNAFDRPVLQTVPELKSGGAWEILVCTEDDGQSGPAPSPVVELCGRSLMLLRWSPSGEESSP